MLHRMSQADGKASKKASIQTEDGDKADDTEDSQLSPPPPVHKKPTAKSAAAPKKLPAGKVKLPVAVSKQAIAIGTSAGAKKKGARAFKGLQPKAADAPVDKKVKGKKVEIKVSEKKKASVAVKANTDDEGDGEDGGTEGDDVQAGDEEE